MKAKSRRRVLVSSVAMLLVAMLALGTATFAWFTTDTTTTASGVQVKTDKQSTLMVSSRTSAWTNDLDYGFINKSLNPVSSADGTNWFYATAASSSASTAKGGTVGKIADNTSNAAQSYMFYNMLNVKNMGTADIENPVYIELDGNITETSAGTSSAKYLRVALVPSGCTTDGGRSSATVTSATDFKSNIYGATNGDSANAVKTISGTSPNGTIATTDAVSTKASGANTIKVKVADSMTAGEAKYYMLIVWFEGQDGDCKDTESGNSMPELNFNIYEQTT